MLSEQSRAGCAGPPGHSGQRAGVAQGTREVSNFEHLCLASAFIFLFAFPCIFSLNKLNSKKKKEMLPLKF